MAEGPGKYDDLATLVRERAEAACVIVTVIGGNKGSGFSIQALDGMVDPRAVARVLRDVATSFDIAADAGKTGP